MGVIGLDYPAVFEIADRLEIPITMPAMRKLQALERFELDRQRAAQEKGE